MSAVEDRRREFDARGILIFDPEVPEELLDRIVTSLADKYVKTFSHGRLVANPNRIQDAWWAVNEVRELALWPAILRFVSEIYQAKPRAFQTLNFPRGTQQPIHSDTIHFNSKPGGQMCGIWVALENVQATAGPLTYYPGSHKLPEYTMQDVGTPPGHEYYGKYEEFIANVIRERSMTPEYAEIRKGMAVLWAANLFHGGAAIVDRKATRHSQVTHYFFDGATYYTPLMSTPTHTHWRQPVWIH